MTVRAWEATFEAASSNQTTEALKSEDRHAFTDTPSNFRGSFH